MYRTYALYDENMQPLYVGVTANIKQRIEYHHKRKEYGNKINYIAIGNLLHDRENAFHAERKLISELKPFYNKRGHYVSERPRYKTSNPYSIIADKINYFWKEFLEVKSIEEKKRLINLFDMSRDTQITYYMEN